MATFPLPNAFDNLAPVEIPPEPPPATTTSYSVKERENNFNPYERGCLATTSLNKLEEETKFLHNAIACTMQAQQFEQYTG